MGHYLTQPEEIDFILMAEKYDIANDVLIPDGTQLSLNTPNGSADDFVRTVRDTATAPQVSSWQTASR